MHRFFNDVDEDIKFAVELRPAHQRFDQSIYIFYELANDVLKDDSGFISMMNFVSPRTDGGYALAGAYRSGGEFVHD